MKRDIEVKEVLVRLIEMQKKSIESLDRLVVSQSELILSLLKKAEEKT